MIKGRKASNKLNICSKCSQFFRLSQEKGKEIKSHIKSMAMKINIKARIAWRGERMDLQN